MAFELQSLAYEVFLEKLAEQQGIVEERIEAPEIRSPSVQLRVTPLGEVELLSTHDQMLGGASGQSYLGCRFPADDSYASLISREAKKIGVRLGKEGVIGRFALDFVVARAPGEAWKAYAIEINLRKGGTTHPFLTLQFLTDGTYDPVAAHFTAPDGKRKHFVASDHVEGERYRQLTPEDLFDVALRHGLHFDQTRLKGIVFHMMSALPECGRTGLTAVADSAKEADDLYQKFLAILDAECRPRLCLKGAPAAPARRRAAGRHARRKGVLSVQTRFGLRRLPSPSPRVLGVQTEPWTTRGTREPGRDVGPVAADDRARGDPEPANPRADNEWVRTPPTRRGTGSPVHQGGRPGGRQDRARTI